MIGELFHLVASLAPSLAGALMGNWGGLVVEAISKVFGVDSDKPDELIKAIQADGNAKAKLQEIENNYKLQFSQEHAGYVDVLDARSKSLDEDKVELPEMHNGWMKDVLIFFREMMLPILAFFLTGGFFTVIILIMIMKQDPNDHDVLNILMGVLGTAFVQVIQFYFGNSYKVYKK